MPYRFSTIDEFSSLPDFDYFEACSTIDDIDYKPPLFETNEFSFSIDSDGGVNSLINEILENSKWHYKNKRRYRMRDRANKMRTNFIQAFNFVREGDEFVDERGSIRFVLQGMWAL